MSGISPSTRSSNEAASGTNPFFTLPKALSDVFQPNMRPADFAVYAVLARRANFTANANNSMRELAKAANVSTATALRSIEMLEHLGLVTRTRRGGSQANEYDLVNALEAATKLGAVYHKRTVSYSLSTENIKRLQDSIRELERNQRNARSATKGPSGVSPVIHQRFRENQQRATSETQTGSHLIQEERRSEEVPTPTPPQDDGAQTNPKGLPDEDEPDANLRVVRAQFTGVIDDFRCALLSTNRPTALHLSNGADDWKTFGVNSWAVQAATWRGNLLVLTLQADDPAAAERGLVKYRKRWAVACLKWFQSKVEVQWVKALRG
jgi:predicted transcriptional regulator